MIDLRSYVVTLIEKKIINILLLINFSFQHQSNFLILGHEASLYLQSILVTCNTPKLCASQ